jgi:hypothetical protein
MFSLRLLYVCLFSEHLFSNCFSLMQEKFVDTKDQTETLNRRTRRYNGKKKKDKQILKKISTKH